MAAVLEIPADQYHSDLLGDRPSLSASIAKLLITHSPAHARAAHPRLNPDYERLYDEKFDVGTAAHALLLQGMELVDVLGYDSWRTQASKDEREQSRAHGRVPLLTSQWDNVRRMVNATREQLAALNLTPAPLANGLPEQTITWEEHGVYCRARLDWLHNDHTVIDDVKTTSASASPEAWGKTMFGMGAEVQVALYRRGVRAVFGDDPDFRFVVVETQPPYALSVVSLAPSALSLAEAKVDFALKTWRECLETDVWPAYPPRVAYIESPGWAENAWLEKEAREEVRA